MVLASSATLAQTWKINLRDADLTAFINEVADITGKNFAVDPRVRGNVTVISNKPLNKAEVYDLFLGVLNVNGIVAIPSGNTIKITPDSLVKNSAVPFDIRQNIKGEQFVTRVIWLDNTNAQDLIPALRPLMPQYAHISAVAGTNAIIVSDRASNINQLEHIIRNLDGTGQNDIEAVSLRFSQAVEMIGLLEAMSGTGTSKDVLGSRVRIVAESRTNRIIIKGDPATRKRIGQMIKTLDVPSAERLDGLKVFRLKYASAQDLAKILQGLVSGKSDDSRSTTTKTSEKNPIQSIVSGDNQALSATASNQGVALNSDFSTQQKNDIHSFSANGVSIIADSAQNALVVKADPQLMREIESAIQQLDIRRQQVLIEAAIVEITGNDADQLGVQWALGDLSHGIGLVSFDNVGSSLTQLASGYLTGGAAGLGSAAAGMTGSNLLLGTSKETADGSRQIYGALIQALKKNSKSNLLSTPSIVTMDNEEAYIVVGQNVPFVTGSVSTQGGTANPYTSIERKDVGVTLKVVPHIGEGGSIRLQVAQEVSAVEDKGQASDLVTSKRAIKTSILAEHGQTIVLGGLISDNSIHSRQAIPGLGELPFIGRLFRADAKKNEKRNLVVFIHPTIIGDGQSVQQLSQQRYQQLYSLQLALDKDGSFAKLPENVTDIYQQRIPVSSSTVKPTTQFQTLPSGGTTAITTPSGIKTPVTITPVAGEG
ncbi:type II secretion system secretin GspD [Acinetobacter sp. SAAs470]|uniref:type II secretion system secretin GspD n=1 Tax=unclassified Acinetobacter TaxID=196816 RepID=UPI0039775A1E